VQTVTHLLLAEPRRAADCLQPPLALRLSAAVHGLAACGIDPCGNDEQRKGTTVDATNNRPTDEVQIRDLIEAWARAVRANDMDGIRAHHAPDIVLFDVPPPVQLRGADAYRKSWEQFFPGSKEARLFELSDLHITAGDDVAFCHGLIRCGGTEQSGDTVELVVRLTVCYRKIDGQWTVTHEHHSEPSNS
jgi:uncharacterized protein (TIGR02246 family)